jgi:phosphoserine phosphatase
MRLILIRHGETDWNIEGRYQGQANPPLNEEGIRQGQRLARKLEGAGLDALYTSPLSRASQTARIISDHLGVPLYSDSRFMEIHQGEWQERLRSEIQSLYPDLFKRWETEPWEVCPPNGETLRQVQERVEQAVDEIISRHTDETIGIVSHRIPIALIKMRYQSLDANIVRTLHLPNTYFEELQVPHEVTDDT